jgi:isoleucyl-tRNA synthetase
MVLALRRKVSIKVRQPLRKIMVPVLDQKLIPLFEAVKNLIISEVNVKEVEYLADTKGILVKKIKPNFKTLGPKYSKLMKAISAAFAGFNQDDIYNYEKNGGCTLNLEGQEVILLPEDAEIMSEDIPGWLVASEGKLTVALDITITEELRNEGVARELINRIQNIRKDSDFDVTDRIHIEINRHPAINSGVEAFAEYIKAQTLAESLKLVDNLTEPQARLVDLDEENKTFIKVSRIR